LCLSSDDWTAKINKVGKLLGREVGMA